MKKKRNKWTQEEVRILQKKYGIKKEKLSKLIPNHPWNTIRMKAQEMGLTKRERNIEWTAVELDILKKNYSLGVDVVKTLLPNRSKPAIIQRAKITGLAVKAPKVWSVEELGTLIKYYPIEGSNVYKRLPGRTRVAATEMARKHNIKMR